MTRTGGGCVDHWNVASVVKGGQQEGLHYNEISITGAIRRMNPLHPAMRLPSRTPMTRMTHLHARWLVFIVASMSFSAQADESANIRRLYAAGYPMTAMARVDQSLAAQPNDLQLRFLKGAMLADAKRNVEATVLFQKLTEDFPDLAEPYNNLAALYAATGEYQKARDALEQSLRNNPNYPTAHENLGDVLAVLARQSYIRALQLAPNNVVLTRKLAVMSELPAPIDGNSAAPRGGSDSVPVPAVTPGSK